MMNFWIGTTTFRDTRTSDPFAATAITAGTISPRGGSPGGPFLMPQAAGVLVNAQSPACPDRSCRAAVTEEIGLALQKAG